MYHDYSESDMTVSVPSWPDSKIIDKTYSCVYIGNQNFQCSKFANRIKQQFIFLLPQHNHIKHVINKNYTWNPSAWLIEI